MQRTRKALNPSQILNARPLQSSSQLPVRSAGMAAGGSRVRPRGGDAPLDRNGMPLVGMISKVRAGRRQLPGRSRLALDAALRN